METMGLKKEGLKQDGGRAKVVRGGREGERGGREGEIGGKGGK